jgi:hypothetical protein
MAKYRRLLHSSTLPCYSRSIASRATHRGRYRGRRGDGLSWQHQWRHFRQPVRLFWMVARQLLIHDKRGRLALGQIAWTDPLTPLSRSYSSCHGLHPHAANPAAHPGTWVGDAAGVLIRLLLPPRRLSAEPDGLTAICFVRTARTSIPDRKRHTQPQSMRCHKRCSGLF